MLLRFSKERPPLAVLAMLAASGFFACGCASTQRAAGFAPRAAITSGQVIPAAELQMMLPGVVLGSKAYAVVNSAWLREWYDVYRAELFRLGVVRWDSRFDCNRFVGFYTGLAQASFFEKTFHSPTDAVALALGPFWYRRDVDATGHAIIQAMTERGRIFIDPQTGAEVSLSGMEVGSAFLQFF